MGQVLSASYILDSTGVKKGVAEADASLAGLGGSVDNLSGDLDDKTSKMGKSFESLGNSLGNFGIPFSQSLVGMGEKLDKAKVTGTGYLGVLNDIGTVAGGIVVAGLVAASVEALHLGVNFQKSETQLAAAADISVNKANAIGAALLNTGGSTIYTGQQMITALAPVTAQLATISGHALTTSQSVKFMAASSDLAEASNTSLSSSTKDLAGVMQAFQVPVGGAVKVSNELYTTSKLTGNGIDTLSSTMDRLKSRLGVTTPTVGDLDTLLVDLGEHGVSGSKGLLVVNTAMTTLLGSTQKVDTATAKAANTFSTKMASAQDAVAKAEQRLATAQAAAGDSSSRQSLTSASAATASSQQQVAALQAVQSAQQALSAKQTEIAASGKNTVTDQMDLQKLQMSLTDAQAKQASLASSTAARGALATATAQDTQGKSTASLAAAQQALVTAQAKVATVQATGGASTNATIASLQQLGLNVYNAKGNFVGMGNIIDQLQPKLKGLTQQQQLAALSAAFGTSASKALLSTVLAGPAAYEKAQKAVEQSNAAHAAAEKQNQSLAKQMDLVKVSLIDLATKWGTMLIPVVTSAGHALADVVGFFDHNRVAAIALAGVIGGVLATAVGVFAVNMGVKVVKSVDNAISSLGKLANLFKGGGGTQEAATGSRNLAAAQDAVVQAQEAVTASTQEVNASQGRLADAMLTRSHAQDAYTAAIRESRAALGELQAAQDELASSSSPGDTAKAEQRLAAAQDQVTTATDKEKSASQGAVKAKQEYADATTSMSSSLKGQKTAGTQLAEANDVLSESQAGLARANGETTSSYESLASVERAQLETNATIASSNDAMAASSVTMAEAQQSLPEAFAATGEAEEEFATTSEEAGEASASAFGPVGLIIMGLVTVGTLVVSHWKEISKDLSKAWNDVFGFAKKIFGDVESFFKKWGEDILLALVPAIGIPVFLATHWHQVETDAKRIWGDIVSFFTKIPGELLGALGSLGSGLADLATKAWQGFLAGVQAAEGALKTEFVTIPTKILGWLGDAGSWLLNVGKDAITGLWNGFVGMESWIGTQELHIVDWVVGALKDAGSWLLNVGKDAIVGLWNGFVGLNSWLGSQLKSVGSWVWGAMKDAGTWLVQTGKNVLIGFWNGLVGDWDWLVNKVEGLFKNSFVGKIASWLGISSPSTVFAEMGMNTMLGLAQGITGASQLPVSALQKVATSLSTSVPITASSAGALGAAVTGGATAAPATAVSTQAGPITLQITVQGSVLTNQELTNAVWQGLIQKGLVNGTGGQLPMPSSAL
jgi:TP901 family phage tail tape measure protein